MILKYFTSLFNLKGCSSVILLPVTKKTMTLPFVVPAQLKAAVRLPILSSALLTLPATSYTAAAWNIFLLSQFVMMGSKVKLHHLPVHTPSFLLTAGRMCNAAVPLTSQQHVHIHSSFFLDAVPRFCAITSFHVTTIPLYSLKARIDVWINVLVPSFSWTRKQWLGMELQGEAEGWVWSIVTWAFAFDSYLEHLQCYHATN